MLSFLISTITFSAAVYGLNIYFNAQNFTASRSRTVIVMFIATLISIASGWATDQLDGEAELHKNDPSIIYVLQSGDPIQIAKLLTGFN
jgi:hypothetical protein